DAHPRGGAVREVMAELVTRDVAETDLVDDRERRTDHRNEDRTFEPWINAGIELAAALVKLERGLDFEGARRFFEDAVGARGRIPREKDRIGDPSAAPFFDFVGPPLSDATSRFSNERTRKLLLRPDAHTLDVAPLHPKCPYTADVWVGRARRQDRKTAQ